MIGDAAMRWRKMRRLDPRQGGCSADHGFSAQFTSVRFDMKRTRTWILVADGGSARFVRQLRADPLTGVRLEDLQFSHERKRLGQIMSDRPGRSFASEK